MFRRNIIALAIILTGNLCLSAQGIRLFSQEMRDVAPYSHKVVMNFIERYFGADIPELKNTTLEHKMADDKVFFRKGSISDLRQLTDSMPFSINLIDKYYEVSWTKQNVPFITIVFPAQYDLLLGMRMDEAQDQLKDAIIASPERIQEIKTHENLQQIDDSIFQFKTSYFELENLTDAHYYKKVRDSFLPVFDKEHLDYSAANLFQGIIKDVDYLMYVEQSIYGMKTINYTIRLQQWLNYCAQLGMKVYFAVEEQREDGILALVIAQSRELGFNHLLSVIIPDKFALENNAVLKVRLSPYIPTHNVKDLYQKYTTNHQKKIW